VRGPTHVTVAHYIWEKGLGAARRSPGQADARSIDIAPSKVRETKRSIIRGITGESATTCLDYDCMHTYRGPVLGRLFCAIAGKKQSGLLPISRIVGIARRERSSRP